MNVHKDRTTNVLEDVVIVERGLTTSHTHKIRSYIRYGTVISCVGSSVQVQNFLRVGTAFGESSPVVGSSAINI